MLRTRALATVVGPLEGNKSLMVPSASLLGYFCN